MAQVTSEKVNISAHQDENILVVKRKKILGQACWHGINQNNLDSYLDIIQKEQEFLPRSIMETDPEYKQIIPYLVFKYQNKYFLMQRCSKATEQRLKNKYSLGIGGHVRQEDLTTNNIIDWARREFDEEVSYSGNFTVEPIGLLNDDSNEVGKVHMGLVLLLDGDSADICVKSELKSGVLVSLEDCKKSYDNLESWSQLVVDFLLLNHK